MAIDRNSVQRQLIEDLAYAYGDVFGDAEIESAFNEAWELLSSRARSRTSCPCWWRAAPASN